MAADCGPTCYKGPLAVYSVARARKGWKGKGKGGRTGSGAGARGKQVGRQAGRQQACNLYSAFGSGRVRSSRYIGNHSSKQSRRRMEKISSGNYWQRQQRCERHAVRSEQPQSQPKRMWNIIANTRLVRRPRVVGRAYTTYRNHQ